jgi:hypothetical protein
MRVLLRSLVCVVAVGLAEVATGASAVAQAVNCRGAIENTGPGRVVRAPQAPDALPIKRQVQREAPAAWAKAVALACPNADPTWTRARKRKTTCGFFSSSLRYSCSLTGVPALRRR